MWRLANRIWTSRPTRGALAARATLVPCAALYGALMAAREAAYRRGALPRHAPLLPAVSVGNLTVGGSGKTPIASWVARYYASLGVTPAVILRGYGGDEAELHRISVPQAVVAEHPDRVRAIGIAARRGARVAVLDDGFQSLETTRALDVVLLASESLTLAPWLLPAGPWREPLRALERAQVIIVTRKRASERKAREIVLWVSSMFPEAHVALAELGIGRFRRSSSGHTVGREALRGKRIVAAAAIADFDGFAAQCAALGARARPMQWRDHHRFDERDVRAILQAARRADYVVVTAKDWVKLRDIWPDDEVEPLVAQLEVKWELGLGGFEKKLREVVAELPDANELRAVG